MLKGNYTTYLSIYLLDRWIHFVLLNIYGITQYTLNIAYTLNIYLYGVLGISCRVYPQPKFND